MGFFHYAFFLEYQILSCNFNHNLYSNNSQMYTFGFTFALKATLVD